MGDGGNSPSLRQPRARFPAPHFRLLHVGADGQDFDAVEVVEVVFDVEFVEVDGGEEGGVVGGGEGCAEEGQGEIGSA